MNVWSSGTLPVAIIIVGALLIIRLVGRSPASPVPQQTVTQKSQLATDDSNEKRTTARSNNPSTFVTAESLFSAYEQNEIKADELFKGHYIEVYGRVSRVGKDIVDTAYITFGSRGQILSTQCMFSKPIPRWLQDVTPGVSLSLICKGNGKMGNILLDDCRAGSMGFETHPAK
jgi:hypothetical protein